MPKLRRKPPSSRRERDRRLAAFGATGRELSDRLAQELEDLTAAAEDPDLPPEMRERWRFGRDRFLSAMKGHLDDLNAARFPDNMLLSHRLAKGLTQAELAKEAGLSLATINNVERGVHLPSRDTCERLIEVLGSDEIKEILDARASRAKSEKPLARGQQVGGS